MSTSIKTSKNGTLPARKPAAARAAKAASDVPRIRRSRKDMLFRVKCFSDDYRVYRGAGITLEDVLAREREVYATQFKKWMEGEDSDSGKLIALLHQDIYVLQYDFTVALLRHQSDGTLVEVRFPLNWKVRALSPEEIPAAPPVRFVEYKTKAEVEEEFLASRLKRERDEDDALLGDPARSKSRNAADHPAAPAKGASASSDNIRVHITGSGPHILEILTRAEWLALGPAGNHAEFLHYRKDCYVRMKPE